MMMSTTAAVAAVAMVTGTPTNTWTEIEYISDQVRRALECPVCLMLAPNMTSICPNRHTVCPSCEFELWNRTVVRPCCPLCRSPLVAYCDVPCVMAVKVAEVTVSVRLACTYRKFGCNELYFVRDIIEHERVCEYKPNTRCLEPTCRWLGTYGQLHEHVGRVHPHTYIETTRNFLCVDNINQIAPDKRLMYLVRSPTGMFWVMLSRMSRSRIRTGVFMVEGTADTEKKFGYRVTWLQDWARIRNKRVGLSTSLSANLRGDFDNAADTFTVIRSKSGRVEFNWYPIAIGR